VYQGKGLESFGRKDENETGSNIGKSNQMQLVAKRRPLAGEVERSYSSQEQEIFLGVEQSVRTVGQSQAVRKLMKRVINWENAWQEDKGLVVRELGTRIITGEWLTGDEALVKERRVTGREFMTFASGSKDSIALELSSIHPFS
jgi:hypothetical protein